jgi:hypothetical protein
VTTATPLFDEAEIDQAQRILSYFAQDWAAEVPMRIHESGHDAHWGLGSSPPFAPEFIGYIGGLTCRNIHCTRCKRAATSTPRDDEGYSNVRRDNHRVRTTRAFRKLRKYAPLEYDVLWMAVMYHFTVAEIADRLNERAILKGYPDRYRLSDVAILAVAGIDKASKWF